MDDQIISNYHSSNAAKSYPYIGGMTTTAPPPVEGWPDALIAEYNKAMEERAEWMRYGITAKSRL
jgi:hypothetical protein